MPLCLTSSHHSPVIIKSISSTEPRFYGNITQDTVPANGRLCFGVVVFDPSKGKPRSTDSGESSTCASRCRRPFLALPRVFPA